MTGGRHLVRESTLDEFPLYLRLASRAAPTGTNAVERIEDWLS